MKATFFVVASDLERWPRARERAEELVRAGHELASHTWSHPYALTRLGAEAIAEEIDRAHRLLSEVRGIPVAGFRAPGYTQTDTVLALLEDRGYLYDSSLFPCPPYYLAKAAVLGWMGLRGRRSESILDRPSVMWERRHPHMRLGLVEVPMTVLGPVRFPLIGTSLIAAGERGYGMLRPFVKREPFVNLEFHAVDLMNLEEDGLARGLKPQRDLGVAVAAKRALFQRVVGELHEDWGIETLEALAPRLAAEP